MIRRESIKTVALKQFLSFIKTTTPRESLSTSGWLGLLWFETPIDLKTKRSLKRKHHLQSRKRWVNHPNIPIPQMDGIYIPTLDTFGMVQPPGLFSLLASSQE